ncbi:hypothetical protein Tco_0507862 [Tanacetum coccineum]
MLKDFDREDVVTLWKLVKDRFMTELPKSDLEKCLFWPLKVMFEPVASDGLWQYQAPIKDWKLYSSCRVHCLSMEGMVIYMLDNVEYPLPKSTLQRMLDQKCEVSEFNEELIHMINLIRGSFPLLEYFPTASEVYSTVSESFPLLMFPLLEGFSTVEVFALLSKDKDYLKSNAHVPSKRVEPFSLQETSVVTMADQRTMAELLQAPTEGYRDVIVIPAILTENFELKHHSLSAAAGGNLLTKTPRDALTIIENKSKVRNSRNKPVVSKVSANTSSSTTSCPSKMAALTDAVNAMLHHVKTSPPEIVKAIYESCVTCGGPHPYYKCLVANGNTFNASAAATTYNQNQGYRPQGETNYRANNQMGPPGFLPCKIIKTFSNKS